MSFTLCTEFLLAIFFSVLYIISFMSYSLLQLWVQWQSGHPVSRLVPVPMQRNIVFRFSADELNLI